MKKLVLLLAIGAILFCAQTAQAGGGRNSSTGLHTCKILYSSSEDGSFALCDYVSIQGGKFKGKGIEGKVFFNPAKAGVGSHTITYVCVGKNGEKMKKKIIIQVEE